MTTLIKSKFSLEHSGFRFWSPLKASLTRTDRSALTLEEQASHTLISKKKLSKLAESREPAIRILVAKNSRTPVKVYRTLLYDDAISVRLAALENPKINSLDLYELSQDGASEVRQAVASHSKTDFSTFTNLLKLKAHKSAVFANPAFYNHLQRRAVAEGFAAPDEDVALDWLLALYVDDELWV